MRWCRWEHELGNDDRAVEEGRREHHVAARDYSVRVLEHVLVGGFELPLQRLLHNFLLLSLFPLFDLKKPVLDLLDCYFYVFLLLLRLIHSLIRADPTLVL